MTKNARAILTLYPTETGYTVYRWSDEDMNVGTCIGEFPNYVFARKAITENIKKFGGTFHGD